MEGKLELYQQELNVQTQTIFERLEYYRKTMFEIRKLLKDYFFNTWRTQRLTEVAKGEEVVFSFNIVQKAMEDCLVDENILIETAQTIVKEAENPSFIAAFDHHVLKSGLPLELNQEDGLFLFKPEKPYTPMAQVFMRQFAYALSIYRVCLGACETYFAIYSHQGINTTQQKDYIESANFLKQQLHEEVDLISLCNEVKKIENEILSLLHTEKVHEGLDQFKKDIDTFKIKLVTLLESGANYLQDSYKEFPNNPILWILHDRSWHALLKTISGLLYAQQYNYSTLYGTLEIKKEFIGLIKTEIDKFDTAVLAKTPLLKIELLKKAAKLINEIKIDILGTLAEKEIEMVEAPKVDVFSPRLSHNIYGLYFAYHKSQLTTKDPIEEEHVEKEQEELYKPL
ncbi:hypothetical protein [Legionella cincinnatiensis]|uniref:Coiled-coil protein n=1 Tax=Legionella cincinnatiensis TaxID=28085 RepID=A0A378IHR7_9GAMM|nr:hypothetical protein [Legionella cincinnatiensis]KTC81919.1 coiled-coil protein [Legionella cincinnatiensis]STX34699.1 coiled-coil protein [Legionella cincinnatiensis]